MVVPRFLASLVVAAMLTTPATANERTILEGVVTVRGVGTVTCGADTYCSGTATVDVTLAGPEHLPRGATGASVPLWLTNRAARPHLSFSVVLDEENRVDGIVQSPDFYVDGPDTSSGLGPGTFTTSRPAGPSARPYTVDVTFAGDAVLIEHIL